MWMTEGRTGRPSWIDPILGNALFPLHRTVFNLSQPKYPPAHTCYIYIYLRYQTLASSSQEFNASIQLPRYLPSAAQTTQCHASWLLDACRTCHHPWCCVSNQPPPPIDTQQPKSPIDTQQPKSPMDTQQPIPSMDTQQPKSPMDT
jgi:hypothetical protein